MTRRDWYGLAVASPVTDPFDRVPEVMPRRRRVGRARSATATEWLRANLIAFDERRSSPLTNLGTLGSAGNATATGTRRLVNNETGAVVWVSGVSGNGLSTTALTMTGATSLQVDFDITPDALTTGGTKQLAGQFSGSAGNRGWQLYASTTLMGFFFSADGTATTGNPICAYSTLGFGAGRIRGRVIWRANNGSGNWDVRWYTLTAEGAATLVETDTGSGTSSIFNSTQAVEIGGRVGFVTDNFPMVVHSVNISVDGVLQRGIDPSVLTDEGASSFTATTGQTVTINRGTGAAYKTATVLPGSAKRLFNGTSSDFLAMADVADIGAGDSCSVWALVRQWATPVSNGRYWSKWDGSSGAGWHLSSNGTALTVNGYVDDGPDSATAVTPAMTAGGLSLIGFTLDRSTNLLTPYMNGTAGTAVSASSIGDLTNTEILYYGRNAANNANQAHESPLRGIYPGALTAAQWAALRDALLVPERAAA